MVDQIVFVFIYVGSWHHFSGGGLTDELTITSGSRPQPDNMPKLIKTIIVAFFIFLSSARVTILAVLFLALAVRSDSVSGQIQSRALSHLRSTD